MSQQLPSPGPEALKCRRCGRCSCLVQDILDPRTGRTVRLFRCDCGERVWDHDQGRPD